MAKKTVRLREIAEKLGVSVVTVSKALADKEGVGAPLRQKIKDTATKMGYFAKSPTHQHAQTGVLGILMAEHLMKPEHSFYWALYLNLIDCLKGSGYCSMFEFIRAQEPPSAPPAFLAADKVDGLVVLGALPLEYLRLLSGTGLPLVQADCHCDEICAHSVIANGFLGTAETTRYLIQKGHTRIGLLGDARQNSHTRDCYYGFLRALEEAGLPLRQDWILSDRNGVEFKTEYELPDDLPTAFVCNSDQGAYHFVRDLQRRGYRVPEDISIIGFYGHVFSSLVVPALTTYRISLREMAQRSVDAYTAMLVQRETHRTLSVICGEIVERQSVLDLCAGG